MSTDTVETVTESNSARKRRLAREFNERRAQEAPSRGINELTRTERDELNALSKDVFGASSRWQKLVNVGVSQLVTEETTELVPGEKEGDEPTTRKVQVPVKTSFGAFQSVTKRYTVDSIKEFMTERKKQLDALRAAIKKQQDEARAKKEAAEKVHLEAGGSAV